MSETLIRTLAAGDRPHAGLQKVHREAVVPVSLDDHFAIFSDASNLERLTPPWINFRIRTPLPIEMKEGAVIDYQIVLYGVPVPWRTRIDAWEPGTRQAYHAVTLGFYEGELLRRIDPQHRSLGQFFQDEIAAPLGLDFYIRLPESIPDSRLATLIDPGFSEMLFGFPFRMAFDVWNPHSNIRRALSGSELAHDDAHIYPRNLEIPAGGGVGTARALAHAYSVFATGGKELGLRDKTLQELTAPAIAPTHGFFDECIKGEAQFSLGFMKSCPGFPFGNQGSFGHPGAGGSLGFADPGAQIGYGYIPNRKSVAMGGDPRDAALRKALYAAAPVI